MSGPFAVLMSFLSEFHGKKHRDGVMQIVGIACSFGSILLPLMAYAILPFYWNFVLVEHFLSK